MIDRNKLAGMGAGLLAATVMFGAGTAGAQPAAGEYVFGFVTETTGPLAAAGVSYHRGAQVAVEEINASKWIGSGVTVKLSEKESGSDAARAVQAMTQFVADRNVLAVTCCILSPVAGAMRPVAANAKIPLVFYGATLPGLPQPPYVSSVVALPGPQEVKMTQLIVDKMKPKSVAYFVNADNEGFQNRFKAAQKVMEGAGVKTAGVVSILSADTDFTAPATQAMGMNPDLIMVWTTQTPAAGIIAALRNRGYAGAITASDVIAPNAVFKKIGEPLAGVPFPIAFAAGVSSSPEAKAFADAFQKKFGELPDTYAAQGYTSVWYMSQGLKSLSGKANREALATALAKVGSIEHNVYGGLPMVAGQADVQKALVVNWSKDGKVVAWEPK
ncbi:ABC transporter substrate-binding protein [Pinisolibacter aquiterrae]|uniref:ABC transporter substrate-binding protein n=1 Tax=Pinisolibacter aquiterrae TaxID=2815579 RepID=UPI001C3D9913|nr:ABC transporter substrate-binding protein [Pinisolibacter aquiterrae]MBV5264921.1 ABC transporter substrate-binding protein [Pinisolibacter aquiterrae]MCC8234339.1 ABC transporter substrate-binding protein [Pinisolibacter aquiterrae]